MNLTQLITVVIMSLTPAYGDRETWEEREKRVGMIAVAIDEAAARGTCVEAYEVEGCEKVWPGSKRELAMVLVATGYFESKFAKNVHEGKCKSYECDSYRRAGQIVHRARSLWQIQKTGLVTRDEYEKMKSMTVEGTTTSAIAATRHIAIGMKKCKTILGAFSMYSGAKVCSWKDGRLRENFFRTINDRPDEEFKVLAENQKKKIEEFEKKRLELQEALKKKVVKKIEKK